ncbi:MAG TPA: EI24 domain-containing protein [Ignavibacteria bacterium]|nr:EI24 domain-containing protein [Ignavibacteria bacterium]
MSDLFFGIFYPLKCIKLFFKVPKIILYSLTPLILNALIYGVIFYFALNWINDFSGSITQSNIPDAGFLNLMIHYSIMFIAVLNLLILSYFFFITVGGIISAPFNEKVSVIVEEYKTGIKVINDKSFLKDAFDSIKAEVVKIGFNFAVIIPLWLLGLIPVIGIAFTFLGILFSFFYNALDYLDIPMSRRDFPFKKKLKIVFELGLLTFGFGFTAFLCMFIPFVNVILKPLIVVSGTSLFFDRNYLNFKSKID